MYRLRILLAAAAFAALCATASAATAPTIVTPATAKWQAVPGFNGWQMAPIAGDPSKAGAYYAYFLKGSTAIPPHFHKMTENVVIVSGTLMVGLGDTVNPAKMMSLGAGSAVSMPAGVHHYATPHGEVVLEISGLGPDTTTMVHK